MLVHEHPTNVFTPWHGEPINDISHPLNIEELWTDAELAAVGLYRLTIDDTPPRAGSLIVATSYAKAADRVVGTHQWETPPISVSDVIAERERRLTLGFTYQFPDARGAHHIGTTPSDMIGWDEVTKSTQAMIALGNGAAALTIVTNTGPVQITALEWQQILIAATAARHPIWMNSFQLQAMNPILADYTADSYWT